MNDLAPAIDIATLLREGTAAAHQENSQGAVSLARGELDKNEYIRFLIIIWHVYTTLEDALNQHATHHVLQHIYNPTLLARAPALSADISHLLSVPESEWQCHPLALSISQNPPEQLQAYTRRIHTVTSSTDPSLLLAHAYVRYLGDLSGGQIVRHHVKKAYHLDDTLGTQFYQFQTLGGGGVATMGDLRAIKVWFRDGMNQGVGDDDERKAALVAEANIAFQLNADIVSTLRAPASHNSSTISRKSGFLSVAVRCIIYMILTIGFAHFALGTDIILW